LTKNKEFSITSAERYSLALFELSEENDLLNLAEIANKTKSILVSTQKDFVRVPKSYKTLVNILDGEIIFENEELIKEILTNVIENHLQNAK